MTKASIRGKPIPLGKSLKKRDWSFSELTRSETLWGPHGYHRYPAKFIPQLVRRIIDHYSDEGSLVADPFLGSATTGIEAIRSGRRFWGGDINPVAVLISQAKCAPISPDLLKKFWGVLETRLSELKRIGRRQLKEFEKARILAIDIAHATPEERFQYWFPRAYTQVLEEMLLLINEIPDRTVHTFFLCAFSNILRGCSIWLSGSTKPQKDLDKFLADPVEAFLRQACDMIRRNSAYWEDLLQSNITPSKLTSAYEIGVYDARQLALKDGEVDLIVTSPPYATCYQYLDIHQLTQLWFERYDVLPAVNVHHGCIGERRVTPQNGNGNSQSESTGSTAADRALRKLERQAITSNESTVQREIRALRNYYNDMRRAMVEFSRVIAPNKHLVLIVGNSRKRGVTIPTSDALCEIASVCGFELEERIVRKIPVRVLVRTRNQVTGRFSSSLESDSQAYPEEDILIFRSPARRIQKKGRTNVR
ncbi:MAG: site-specific DNA-methyltransferase [Acidobacteria bacterium]|nr:site-specific DNA-methyltransferase [Acidobacteriota bacterium]